MNRYQPTFSICIPNYNYGEYIGDTIQSVLNQTYEHFEIIVVDNASTDNSIEIIESFKDPRIKLYKNNYNIGFAPNLQKATSLASNDFINLLSSDDQMKPTAIETYASIICENIEQKDQMVLLSDYESFDDNNRVTAFINKSPISFGRTKSFSPHQNKIFNDHQKYRGWDVLKDCLSRLDTVGGFLTTVYSRKLWVEIEGYNSVRTINPDMHFILKLLTLNPTVIYVNQTLFRYRDQLSDNRTAVLNSVRLQIDQFLNVLEFGTQHIANITGLKRKDLEYIFVNIYCLDRSIMNLTNGNYSLGFKIFAFAMSTYPSKVFANPKTYPLLLLLALGPLSKLILGPVKSLYLRFRNPNR